MRWLEQNLRFASGVAAAGPVVKASGERYASASTHLAMALHMVLDEVLDKEDQSSPLSVAPNTSN